MKSLVVPTGLEKVGPVEIIRKISIPETVGRQFFLAFLNLLKYTIAILKLTGLQLEFQLGQGAMFREDMGAPVSARTPWPFFSQITGE